MLNLKPTGNYCYIQLTETSETEIVMPDGTYNPNSEVKVIAIGPDVKPPVIVGCKVHLRPDLRNILGIEERYHTAMIDAAGILAVIDEDSAL